MTGWCRGLGAGDSLGGRGRGSFFPSRRARLDAAGSIAAKRRTGKCLPLGIRTLGFTARRRRGCRRRSCRQSMADPFPTRARPARSRRTVKVGVGSISAVVNNHRRQVSSTVGRTNSPDISTTVGHEFRARSQTACVTRDARVRVEIDIGRFLVRTK